MKNWITNNFFIKIISLIMAIITWIYVNREVIKESPLSTSFYKTSYMRHLNKYPSTQEPAQVQNKGYIMEKK